MEPLIAMVRAALPAPRSAGDLPRPLLQIVFVAAALAIPIPDRFARRHAAALDHQRSAV